jgi:hypothetical protein
MVRGDRMKAGRKGHLKQRFSAGSALILAVVLTSLLATVGVLFLLSRRVDTIATSAIADNQDLNLAVDSVVAKIMEELVLDVDFLGEDANGNGVLDPLEDLNNNGMIDREEYYDYPGHSLGPGLDPVLDWDDQMRDPGLDLELGTADDGRFYSGSMDNMWLADLEPVMVDVGADLGAPDIDVRIGFRHITDLYGRLAYLFQDSFDYSTGAMKPGYVDSQGDRISFRRTAAEIIGPTAPIGFEGDKADADGDGVADSRWVILPEMTSGKGRHIYAAIRIVDNGAKVNVNTVYRDPKHANLGDPDHRRGDRLTDIYIESIDPDGNRINGLVKGKNLLTTDNVDTFMKNRDPRHKSNDAERYHLELSRRVENPDSTSRVYTLYDISEELSLSNRFVLYLDGTMPRLEAGRPGGPWEERCLYATLRATTHGNSFRPYNQRDPRDDPDPLTLWGNHFVPGLTAGKALENVYDFRHLLTTWNMDRIIGPAGAIMIDVNSPDMADPFEELLKEAVFKALSPDPNADVMAAQITANLIDYIDADSQIREVPGPGKTYYGFERPCAYLSELSVKFSARDVNGLARRSYAIELHKPYLEDDKPVGWELVILDPNRGVRRSRKISQWLTDSFQVEKWEDPEYGWVDVNGPNEPNKPDPNNPIDPNDPNSGGRFINPGEVVFYAGDTIELRRLLPAIPAVRDDVNVAVDSVEVPDWLVDDAVPGARSLERDVTRHKCIRRLWDRSGPKATSFWERNAYERADDANMIQAHPADKGFTNVGEIGMVFARPAYYSEKDDPCGVIGYAATADTDDEVRVDLANPIFQQLTNCLTAFDPASDGINNDGDLDPSGAPLSDETDLLMTPELKIPGRININTAPWYVIAQLPWISTDPCFPGVTSFELAQAIVAYRDQSAVADGVVDYSWGRATGMWDGVNPAPPIVVREQPGFASVAELMNVTHNLSEGGDYYRLYDIRKYGRDANDMVEFPDLTPQDKAVDDFEERDLILARISNLVTVRSDVFTSYILVRLGAAGPQNRVIAILDRSNVYPDPDPASSTGLTGRVKLRALHPVPDPR